MIVDLLHNLRCLIARSPGRSDSAGRIEVCPPMMPGAPSTLASGWRGWLDSRLGGTPTKRPRLGRRAMPLAAVKRDFSALLDDIRTQHAGDLQRRIQTANTLRDLWHLRCEAYALVSRQRDQAEAERRLARLNHCFPTRAPRSGFGSFEPGPRAPRHAANHGARTTREARL